MTKTITRSVTRSRNANNNGARSRALSVVAGHVFKSPVSRNRPRNAITAAAIRRLMLAIPALYREYRPLFRSAQGVPIPRHVINFIGRSNVGLRFQRILRNARIVNRHRDGGVTFVLPPTSQYAGRYRLHPNGHVTGNRAHQITAGQGGFLITNVTRNNNR